MPKGRLKGASDTSEIIKNAIIYVKARHPDKSGEWVRKYLINHQNEEGLGIKGQRIPLKRTVEKTISGKAEEIEKAKKRISEANTGGIDAPWSIGSCAEYHFSADMIPILIKQQQLLLKYDFGEPEFSIRHALWFERLYPVSMKILQPLFPEKKQEVLQSVVWHVSRDYSNSEQVSEANGEKIFFTKRLDHIYFTGDLSNKLWPILKDVAIRRLNSPRPQESKENNSKVTLDLEI